MFIDSPGLSKSEKSSHQALAGASCFSLSNVYNNIANDIVENKNYTFF